MTCFGNVGKYGKRIKFYILCSEALSPDKLHKNNADKIPLLSYTKCKEQSLEQMEITHTQLYVIIRQQHKKKQHFVAGSSVAQCAGFRYQSFYIVGSNPTATSCGLFMALTYETCHAVSLKLLCEIWQVF